MRERLSRAQTKSSPGPDDPEVERRTNAAPRIADLPERPPAVHTQPLELGEVRDEQQTRLHGVDCATPSIRSLHREPILAHLTPGSCWIWKDGMNQPVSEKARPETERVRSVQDKHAGGYDLQMAFFER